MSMWTRVPRTESRCLAALRQIHSTSRSVSYSRPVLRSVALSPCRPVARSCRHGMTDIPARLCHTIKLANFFDELHRVTDVWSRRRSASNFCLSLQKLFTRQCAATALPSRSCMHDCTGVKMSPTVGAAIAVTCSIWASSENQAAICLRGRRGLIPVGDSSCPASVQFLRRCLKQFSCRTVECPLEVCSKYSSSAVDKYIYIYPCGALMLTLT